MKNTRHKPKAKADRASCSALSLVRSDQTERDYESYFFVREAGVHRFISGSISDSIKNVD